MPTTLLVFEFLGTTELLVIALVALIIFGPRKLPEIGRTVGKGLAEFKRASEDFKRTWEYEVETEQTQSAPRIEAETVIPRESLSSGEGPAMADAAPGFEDAPEMQTIARGSTDFHDPDAPETGEFPALSSEERTGDKSGGPNLGLDS